MHRLSARLVLPVLLLGASVVGQTTASYIVFGDNCGTSCAGLNTGPGTMRTGTLPNEYSYGHRFSQPTVVIGFQLYTQTASLPVASMTCGVYRESATPNIPDLLPVATGTMTVANRPDFYTVWLDQPVMVNANEAIWISQYDSTLILAAAKTSGSAPSVPTYWRRPPGGGTAWATTGTISFPSWRILCAPDVAMLARGTPVMGGSMTISIQGGPPAAPAALMFGAINPALTLPFCTQLYSSGEVILPLPLSPTGSASFQLNVPNDLGLEGGVVWNQWWAAGPNGLVGTSGGQAIVGR